MTHERTGPDVWVVRRGTGFIYARSLSRAHHSELIVQGRRGRIRIKDNHGYDPVRSKG